MRLASALTLLLGACASVAEPRLELRASGPVHLPPSALGGAVRALETLAAHHSIDTLVEVRAVEASALEGHATPAGLVRVFLHLTVFATTSARARSAFDDLRVALEAEARAPLEFEPVASVRARRVLGASSWVPAGGEELLSYSDALRVEYTPAWPGLASTRGASAGEASLRAPESVGIEDYVRAQAADEGLAGLGLSLRPSAAAPGVSEMRCFLDDAPAANGHRRAEIGAFLAALEDGSPAARVTEVRLEHSRNAADPRAEDSWTFEALLVVRVPAGD